MLTIENALKYNWIYTDILSNRKEAVSLSQIKKTSGGAQVFFVKDKDEKVIYVLKSIYAYMSDAVEIKQAEQEFKLALELGSISQYICKGVDIKRKEKTEPYFYAIEMLFEYGGEDLLSLMRSGRELTGAQIINIAVQIADGMECIQKNKVFHCDLKTSNIVYKDGLAKIIDFGVSREMERTGMLQTYTSTITGNIVGGTPPYMPPEILSKVQLPQDGVEISKYFSKFSREKIDVYLWGMVFYELLSKKSPETLLAEKMKYIESSSKYDEFIKEVKKLKLVGGIDAPTTEAFLELLSVCLSYDPNLRPTFEEINKKFLAKFSGDLLKKVTIPPVESGEKKKISILILYAYYQKICQLCSLDKEFNVTHQKLLEYDFSNLLLYKVIVFDLWDVIPLISGKKQMKLLEYLEQGGSILFTHGALGCPLGGVMIPELLGRCGLEYCYDMKSVVASCTTDKECKVLNPLHPIFKAHFDLSSIQTFNCSSTHHEYHKLHGEKLLASLSPSGGYYLIAHEEGFSRCCYLGAGHLAGSSEEWIKQNGFEGKHSEYEIKLIINAIHWLATRDK